MTIWQSLIHAYDLIIAEKKHTKKIKPHIKKKTKTKPAQA